MASHTQVPGAGERETALPAVRKRPRRRDPTQRFAQVLCVLLALVGLLPFAGAVVVRSSWARDLAESRTEALVRAQGLDARYHVALRIWPLAVELTDVRLESTDGKGPAVTCDRARVRPRLFALLAGKVAIDQVELMVPRVRLVLRDGQVANLALKKSEGPSEPLAWPARAPLNAFAVTDAAFDLDVDGTRVAVGSLDLDVTADQESPLEQGAAFEVALRAGRADLHHARGGDRPAVDDDVLCAVEGRARVERERLLVRRLEGNGSVDLDGAPGTTPACNLPVDDKRRFELALGHLRVGLPTTERRLPTVDGHFHVRVPIGLAERLASLPETDGWIGADADVRFAESSELPDVDGTLEAHDVRLAQFAFAKELHTQLALHKDPGLPGAPFVITSPKTTLRLAGGLITLSDTAIEPLSRGVRLDHARLDASGVEFGQLMRDLGVHPNPHVGWEIREIHTTPLAGTLAPLKIDGELVTKTANFGIYDRPYDDKARERVFGFSEAQVATHVSIRPDALRFQDVHAVLPRSHVDGGLCSIGFHNDLLVEVPHLVADLDDLSPIGPVVMHGKLEASARVDGKFDDPHPEGDIASIANLIVGDIGFGDVSAGHVKVIVKPNQAVEFTGVRAKRRESSYEVPTGTLRFGAGFSVDAVGQTASFGLRDLLSMFELDEDPRYDGIDAKIATRADVHVAVGGPEDACGSGFLSIDAKSHVFDVSLYGEKFKQGDADVSVRWYDRLQGIAGADVDVRSFVLDKITPPPGTRPGPSGTILGSASIRRGGALSADVMLENLPMSRLDSLGAYARDVEGSVSGVAHATGNLDDTRAAAGVTATAEIDVSGTRLRQVPFAPSHLEVRFTHRFPQQKRVMGRTRCGAAIAPPFDRAAFLSDTSSHGEWTLDGSLFGGTVLLGDVVATRARAPHVSGRVSMRGLEMGTIARAMRSRASDSEEGVARPPAVDGQLWAEVMAEDVPLDDPGHARVKLLLGPTAISRAGQKLTLKPPNAPLVLRDDTLTTPPLEVTLDTPEGFRGGFVLSGAIKNVSHDPQLGLDARLETVDLAVLEKLVPRVDRATGTLDGDVHITGRAAAPAVSGELHAKAEAIEVHGLPSAITDVVVDVKASPAELKASGGARFAGGTVSLLASLPVVGFTTGVLDAHVRARDIGMTPAEGVAATFDADLDVAYGGARGEQGALPRITGEVTLDSFDYTRPISLTTDLSQLGVKAKRTEVGGYDPALDAMTFDVRLKARRPLVIKNNLVEVQLALEGGSLEVTGTNQRVGLRGALRTQQGGRFHFQSSEFDVRQGVIRFDDPTRIDPNVDITAVTEYRRYTDTSSGAASGAGTSGTGPAAASAGSTRGGALWRITLHAYGDADNLRVDMTSEPSLSQEDIVLLLAVGMTRAELDQLQASSIGASIALNYLGAASGADQALKQALPVIDDFRFGSAYSTVTGKTEPQLTIGKRLTNDLRASVTAGLSEDRELRSNIEWRLNQRLSVQGSYDNINDVSSSALGNLGVDLRWRLEFE